jgi:TonB family protein
MRSLDRPLCLVTALVLAAASSALAQMPPEAPAPESGSTQAAPAEPGRPVQMTDRERIELCKRKRDQPLEETSSPPSRVGGEIAPPKNIHHPAPQFARSGPQGTIVLEAIIDEDGCVRQVKVDRGIGKAQDAAALKAVRKWVFRPAMYNGQPVRVFYHLTVNYRH